MIIIKTIQRIVILTFILLLVGCTDTKENENAANATNVPNATNAIVLNQVENSEQKTTSENIGKDLISNDRKKCYDIWQTCNSKFYSFINLLEEKNYSEAKYLVTENVVIDKDEIINNEYIKGKKFKLGNFNFGKQRYYDISKDDTVFETGYEVLYDDGGSIDVCYVTFVKKNGDWYIDYIAIDLG